MINQNRDRMCCHRIVFNSIIDNRIHLCFVFVSEKQERYETTAHESGWLFWINLYKSELWSGLSDSSRLSIDEWNPYSTTKSDPMKLPFRSHFIQLKSYSELFHFSNSITVLMVDPFLIKSKPLLMSLSFILWVMNWSKFKSPLKYLSVRYSIPFRGLKPPKKLPVSLWPVNRSQGLIWTTVPSKKNWLNLMIETLESQTFGRESDDNTDSPTI